MTKPTTFPFKPEPWAEQAACIGHDPALWDFSHGGSDGRSKRRARAICAGCPVITQCLEYALRSNSQHLMWGGLCENQRAAIKRGAA